MILREYGISDSLTRRVWRKVVPHFATRHLNFKLDRSVISISFDDFPKSVMENALPLLDQYGWKASFYVAAGLENTTNHLGLHFNRNDLLLLQEQGHEIGCHTYNHLNITELSELLENDFSSMRGIMRGIHYNKADLNQVKSVPIYSGPEMSQTLNYINSLRDKPGWMTLFTHDIRENPSEWGCTPEDFATALAAIQASGAIVMPIQKTIDFLKGKTSNTLQSAGV